MALIKCSECGKEISDKAENCPNCGCPVQNNVTENSTDIKNEQKSKKGKVSGLSIVALVLSILGCTFIIGIILAVVDLCKKDGRNKTCSIIALVICGAWLAIASISTSKNGSSTADSSVQTVSEQESSTKEKENAIPTEEPTPEPTPYESREEFIASCQEIPYKTLARNPDDYIGEHIVLTVKVSQVLQGGFFDSNEYYRVYTDDEYGMWLGDEYFMYDSRVDDDTKILQDDIIKVYAEFAGTETVERALTGTKEDVLAIKAIFIELIEDYDSSENYQTETSQESVDDGLTMGQKNALSSAKSYLSYSAFSYQGLINQLEYEQYSHEDAVYAADNCGADWNEQAALAAKSYLEYSSFSREGLINQLEYEGFTNEQAIYGVEANGY